MLFIYLSLIVNLAGTSGLINIPTVTEYDIPGMWGGGLMYSSPLYNDDLDPNDALIPEPADFNAVLRYGFAGRGEIALSVYTPTTYSLALSYVIKKGGAGPAFFCGIDDITYAKYVSLLGTGDTVGFLEEKGYMMQGGGRPWELLSAYIAMQQTFGKVFNIVIGLGRGKFVGYGERSRIFNTDFFVLGDDYTTEEHSPWAFGLFFGASLRFPFGVEFMGEMDGRDASIGIRYHNKYVTPTIAITKVEQFGDRRPFSPRITLGLEANNRILSEKPKSGTIEIVVQDVSSKELLTNTTIEVAEMKKSYAATSGTLSINLPAGSYTFIVKKLDYVDYTAKVNVKPEVKSKLVFNLNKTEMALRLETAERERENSIRSHLGQGRIYFSENNLAQAKAAFEMVLNIDPENQEALTALETIELRRKQLIDYHASEARKLTQAKDYNKAIKSWQEVLALDPNHATANAAIADLKKLQTTAAKPPPKVQKPAEPSKPKVTEAQIDALYKKGVSLFTKTRYDEALNVFKQVLALNPNHTGAKEYKKRTEARIAILKGG